MTTAMTMMVMTAAMAERLPVSGSRSNLEGYDSHRAERWFRHAVVYCLDVETFQDSDGDGVGDLQDSSTASTTWLDSG